MTAIIPPVFVSHNRPLYQFSQVVIPKSPAPRPCTVEEWRVIEAEIKELKNSQRFFLN